MAAIHSNSSCTTTSTAPSPPRLWRNACSFSSASLSSPGARPLSASILSQAQPSYESSVIRHKQHTVFSASPLQQQDELFRKEPLSKSNGNGRLCLLAQEPALLQAKDDCYDGVIVDPSSLPSDPDAFVDCLRASIAYWRSQHKRGVWLKLPTQNAGLVPAAIKEGFQYHHAEPTHVMMTYWIPDTPSTLPPNASHQVGIGAFVLNEHREVLVVQEKNGPMRGSGVWKMPTGLIDQAEDLSAGAVREVKEETGVDTEFLEVVGFRHGHYVAFEKSDLYFLCVLRPKSLEIVEQDGEIEAAKWMPLEEFRGQPFYNEISLQRKMIDICVASFDRQYKGFIAVRGQTGFQKNPSLYFFNGEYLK